MPVRRALIVAFVAVVGLTLFATSASAHVTVYPSSLPKGSTDVLVGFLVPNESTTGASTTKLEIDLPTATPLIGATAEAIPGWTASVTSTTLPSPVTTDDGPISQVVSTITWTAGTGFGIGTDQFMLFNVLVGQLPSKPSKLVFKAIQTYSDGTVVSWIEPIVKGTPEPEHPTPLLRLTKKAKGT
jgi:uncharacterized protein YcnI